MLPVPAAEANSLVSSDSELPFDYYSMPFCKPEEGIKKSLSSVNPGTILTGSRILNSPYNFTVMVCPSDVSFRTCRRVGGREVSCLRNVQPDVSEKEHQGDLPSPIVLRKLPLSVKMLTL